MAVVSCASCHQPMNAQAVVCPHCNARRTDITTGTAGKKLSRDELRALIVSDEKLRPAQSRGVVSTLILPHPSTAGAARAAELALTVVALPLVLAGALMLMLDRRSRRLHRFVYGKDDLDTRGEAMPVIVMLVAGGIGLYSLLPLMGIHGKALFGVISLGAVALLARAHVRSTAADARSRELTRLEALDEATDAADEAPAPAALPVAQALPRPVVVPPPPASAPDTAAPPASRGGPQFLK